MKYIVIGNAVEWCKASWYEEIKTNKNLYFLNETIPHLPNRFLRKICNVHYSQKLNKRFNFPGKRIWYKAFSKSLGIEFDDEEKYVLIVYDWSRLSRDFNFFAYLKKKCRRLKIVYLFTNIAAISGARMYGVLDELTGVFDRVFAFDPKDAERYDFDYFPLIYTGVNPQEKESCDTDLFYIGQAKDPARYQMLIDIFEKAQKEGLTCDFNIVGVPEEKQKYPELIHYNKRMSYSDVVKKIKRSRCLVDVIQKESSGLTIKVCEAVVYDKKLITSNEGLLRMSLYDASRILMANDLELIHDFLSKPLKEYSVENKYMFSPQLLYEKIEAI